MKDVMGMIDGIPLVGLSAPVLLGLAILMLLKGKLWTDAAYQEKFKESNQWREAYLNEREARARSDSQTRELLELAKTTNSFIVAVFTNSERLRNAGGDPLVQAQANNTDRSGS